MKIKWVSRTIISDKFNLGSLLIKVYAADQLILMEIASQGCTGKV